MLQFCVVCGLKSYKFISKAPAEGTAFGGVIYCSAAKVYAVFIINFYFFKVCAFFVINFYFSEFVPFCHKLCQALYFTNLKAF